MARRPAPELIERQAAIGDLCIAPDGSAVAYTLRRVAGRDHTRHLYLVPWSGGRPRQLTRGARRCSAPAFSPDGSRLAFISERTGSENERAEHRPQVWVQPLKGGEAERVTSFEHGVSEFAWAPDGRRLLIVAPDRESHMNVGERRRGEPTARVIERIDWRLDGAGLLDRREHLHLVAARSGARPRRLTSGDFSVERPRFAPDGRIVFRVDPGPQSDLLPRKRLFAVAPSSGRRRPFLELAGDVGDHAFAADGSALAVIGITVAGSPFHAHPRVLLAGPRGGSARDLAPRQRDLWCGCAADGDLSDWTADEADGPVFAQGGVVALASERGRCLPWRFAAGERAAPLCEQDAVCLTLAEGGGRLAVVAVVDGEAPEVHAVEDGRLRRLTRNGSAWLRGVRRAQVEEFDCRGPAGPIRTTLCSPPGAGSRRLPTVIALHGGPLGAWGPQATLEAELLVARGLRVALPDIRGSIGYGVRWIRQLEGAWGRADQDDVLAVVDHLARRGLADRRRVGLVGLSYGGFLVNWLLAATDRFACGVSENGVTNQVSTWANCDYGVEFDRQAGLGEATTPAGVRRLWDASPLKHVRDLRAPLLLLQAEADLRCPPADNEQLFVALRALGRDVTYVTYPEESHNFQVTGRPDRRIDRARRVVEFLAGRLESTR